MAEEQYKRSYAHLKPYQFKKGKSGNPGGSAKGTISLVALVRRRFREYPEAAQAIMDRVIIQAMQGCTKSQELLVNRMDGKLVDVVHSVTEMEGWEIKFVDGAEDEEDGSIKEADFQSIPNDEDASDPEKIFE